MFKIGEFAILSSISIHMLRHYDEIGLLSPASIDAVTGYRYYKEDQLADANRIVAFKRMGFGLHEIKDLLLDESTLKACLAEKAEQKKAELVLIQGQLNEIASALQEAEHHSRFAGQVAVKEIPPRRVATCRGVLRDYSEEGLLWCRLNAECANQSIRFAAPGLDIAILYRVDEPNRAIDVAVQRTVVNSGTDTPQVIFEEVGPILVASLVFQGGYRQLYAVNGHVAQWVLRNGYELVGPVFNIYHVSPGGGANEADFITECCFPIQKK